MGRKILASIFLGSLSQAGIFLGIQKKRKIRDSHGYVSGRVVPRINFYGSEIRYGMFWGLNFGPGILVLFEALGIFLGFDFCPHSIIPVT